MENKQLKGIFKANSNNANIACVILQDNEIEKIFINNLYDQNQALDDDIVIVQVTELLKDNKANGFIYKVLESKNQQKSHIITIKKENRKYIGIPICKKLPQLYVVDAYKYQQIENCYFEVKIDKMKYHIIEQIGKVGDVQIEQIRVLKQYDLPHYKEQQETLQWQLNEIQMQKIMEFEILNRTDLRQLRIFSIDPSSCRDVDDAISIQCLSNNIYEVGVHISDVYHYVHLFPELEKEINTKLTSVYLANKTFHMLPSNFSENICSLNPKVDKLAISVFFEFDNNNKQITEQYRIQKSVIHSSAKLSYQTVQQMIDNEFQFEELDNDEQLLYKHIQDDCLILNQIANSLKQRRFTNNYIQIPHRDYKFTFDQDTQLPIKYDGQQHLQSQSLVEEYMLMANVIVANYIFKIYENKSILRINQSIDPKREQLLYMYLQNCEITEQVKDIINLDIYPKHIQQSITLKYVQSLQSAEYVQINELSKDKFFHHGLQTQYYTHFTSPIRRCADIYIHKLLTNTLNNQLSNNCHLQNNNLIKNDDYTDIMKKCSDFQSNAKRVSREYNRFLLCKLIEQQQNIDNQYDAIIYDIDKFSIYIYIQLFDLTFKYNFKSDSRTKYSQFFTNPFALILLTKKEKNINMLNKFKNTRKYEVLMKMQNTIKFNIFQEIKVKLFVDNCEPLDIQPYVEF